MYLIGSMMMPFENFIRQTDRQTDRQTEGQIDKEIDRQL